MFDPDASLEQRNRNAIGQTEFGLIRCPWIRLEHDREAGPVGFDPDRFDFAHNVVTRPTSLLTQLLRRVDGSVRVSAAGVHLEAVLTDLPALAQTIGDAGRIAGVRHRLEETAVTFQDAAGTSETIPGQVGSQNAVECGFARVQVFAHRAIGIEFPEAGRLRAGAAQRVQRVFRIEFQQ